MSNLRDEVKQKDRSLFSKSVHALGQFLGVELSNSLSYDKKEIVTPFGMTKCKRIKNFPTIIPILRAGQALQEGISSILIDSPIVNCTCPKCVNGHRLAKMNIEQLGSATSYVICDPMVVKGQSVISVVKQLPIDSSYIYILSCIATDYALSVLKDIFPDNVVLFTCAIDSFVTGVKGTFPGLGDVGDLLYGPKIFSLNIQSIYSELNDNAKRIPANVNVKMIFRHSFRDPFIGESDYRSKLLNEYGIQQAKAFGMAIEYPVGSIYSSELERCRQTVICMTNNDNINVVPEILTTVFTYDSVLADQQIRRLGSLKKTLMELKCGNTLPGFYPLEKIVNKILDFVFSTGNKEHTIDLYCTHDFHIGMMLIMLFDDINTLDALQANWPRMLEGVLLYGSRDSFYCYWRGKSCHVFNGMVSSCY